MWTKLSTPHYKLSALALLLFSANSLVADVVEFNDLPVRMEDRYEGLPYIRSSGFNIYVDHHERQDYSEENMAAVAKSLVVMQRELAIADALLPVHAMTKLKAKVGIILLDYCESTTTRAIYTRGGDQPRVVYYCFDKWAKLYDQDPFFRVDTPPRTGSIAALITGTVSHQSTMLHELAHAWHDQFVENGFGNRRVHSAYEIAKNCDYVETHQYWRKNASEYFAEMSVAYFFRLGDEPYLRFYMDGISSDLIRDLWYVAPDEWTNLPRVHSNCSRNLKLVETKD